MGKTRNGYKIITMQNSKYKVVAENLSKANAENISTSLNVLGISSCYTSKKLAPMVVFPNANYTNITVDATVCNNIFKKTFN